MKKKRFIALVDIASDEPIAEDITITYKGKVQDIVGGVYEFHYDKDKKPELLQVLEGMGKEILYEEMDE